MKLEQFKIIIENKNEVEQYLLNMVYENKVALKELIGDANKTLPAIEEYVIEMWACVGPNENPQLIGPEFDFGKEFSKNREEIFTILGFEILKTEEEIKGFLEELKE